MHPHYVTKSTETNKSNKRPFEKSKYCLIKSSQLGSPANGSMFPTRYAAHDIQTGTQTHIEKGREFESTKNDVETLAIDVVGTNDVAIDHEIECSENEIAQN